MNDFEVKLVPYVGQMEVDTPAGPMMQDVEHDQFRVYVHNQRLPQGKIQVGLIGKHAGANFCPILSFYQFTYPLQQRFAAEAKRLHGNAATTPHVDVPPPPVVGPDDVEEEAESE